MNTSKEKEQRYCLRQHDGTYPLVLGLIVGNFGVHKDDDGYMVTHLPSGLSVGARCKRRTNAMIMAREFDELLGDFNVDDNWEKLGRNTKRYMKDRRDFLAARNSIPGYSDVGQIVNIAEVLTFCFRLTGSQKLW